MERESINARGDRTDAPRRGAGSFGCGTPRARAAKSCPEASNKRRKEQEAKEEEAGFVQEVIRKQEEMLAMASQQPN